MSFATGLMIRFASDWSADKPLTGNGFRKRLVGGQTQNGEQISQAWLFLVVEVSVFQFSERKYHAQKNK